MTLKGTRRLLAVLKFCNYPSFGASLSIRERHAPYLYVMSQMSTNVSKLMALSIELEKAIANLAEASYPDSRKRVESGRILSHVSIEHAQSLKSLIGIGNFTSALGLLRLQYEALVRAMWVTYSATDGWVEKISAELTTDSAKQADKIPLLSEMLGQLEGKAPAEALGMLHEFREYSWKPLSSFVHGGIHAINRHGRGYPVPLLEQAIRASNGVVVMTGMLLVILSSNPVLKGVIPAIQREYEACLPPAKLQ